MFKVFVYKVILFLLTPLIVAGFLLGLAWLGIATGMNMSVQLIDWTEQLGED